MRRKPITEHIEIPEAWKASSDSGLVTKSYDLDLLTPMIGGDAESWVIDKENPVRTQAVKGQLRFWWRTMQMETDPVRLLRMENEIWGGEVTDPEDVNKTIRIKSRVAVTVEHLGRPTISLVNPVWSKSGKFAGVDGSIVPAYILFPVVPLVKDRIDKKRKEDVNIVENCVFKLNLTYPKKLEEAVTNTLKLWVLFGGVGARTRRGTGSLSCPELLSEFTSVEDIAAYLKKLLPDVSAKQHSSPYPQLSGAILASEKNPSSDKDAANVWRDLINRYADNRQGKGLGRRVGEKGRPGRSYWPEPDCIRDHNGTRQGKHKDSVNSEGWFPRAAYGLPIQTEFKNCPTDPSGKINLQPDGFSRWPSPLILKVLRLRDGEICKVILVLNLALPEGMILTGLASRTAKKLEKNEMPLRTDGRRMKVKENAEPSFGLMNSENPYTHLIRVLGMKEVC